MMDNENVVKDLYKDIIAKRNKCKIDLDNYITEIEIIKKSLEYRTSMEDDSRFFSPRSNDTGIESTDDLNLRLDKYEKLAEETRTLFDYYDGYCIKLSEYIKSDDASNNDKSEGSDKDIEYSLKLNYDYSDIKTRLSSIEKNIDLCLKIFDTDRERTRLELKRIHDSINALMEDL